MTTEEKELIADLRNKLTPFFNLAEIMNQEQLYNAGQIYGLTHLDLKQCKINKPLITDILNKLNQ